MPENVAGTVCRLPAQFHIHEPQVTELDYAALNGPRATSYKRMFRGLQAIRLPGLHSIVRPHAPEDHCSALPTPLPCREIVLSQAIPCCKYAFPSHAELLRPSQTSRALFPWKPQLLRLHRSRHPPGCQRRHPILYLLRRTLLYLLVYRRV